ncbi:hypothetical protein THH46_22255 [Pseudomonas sp. NA13]
MGIEVNFIAKSGDDYTDWVKADRVESGAPYGAPPEGADDEPAGDAQ